MSKFVVIANIYTKPHTYKIAYHASTELDSMRVRWGETVPEDLYIQLANPFMLITKEGKTKEVKNEFASYQLAKRFIVEYLEKSI